jgi:regulator of replication initiation timing
VCLKGVLEEVGSLVVIGRLWRIFKIIEEFSGAAEEQLDALEEQIGGLEEEKKGLRSEVRGLRMENEGLKNQVGHLKHRLVTVHGDDQIQQEDLRKD